MRSDSGHADALPAPCQYGSSETLQPKGLPRIGKAARTVHFTQAGTLPNRKATQNKAHSRTKQSPVWQGQKGCISPGKNAPPHDGRDKVRPGRPTPSPRRILAHTGCYRTRAAADLPHPCARPHGPAGVARLASRCIVIYTRRPWLANPACTPSNRLPAATRLFCGFSFSGVPLPKVTQPLRLGCGVPLLIGKARRKGLPKCPSRRPALCFPTSPAPGAHPGVYNPSVCALFYDVSGARGTGRRARGVRLSFV